MSDWWCMNCDLPTELDIHGRCGTCGSNSVAPTSPHIPEPVQTVEEAIAEALFCLTLDSSKVDIYLEFAVWGIVYRGSGHALLEKPYDYTPRRHRE